MSLYISDCENAYVSPGGADGYTGEIDPGTGLFISGPELACKECNTSCSQIYNELKHNKVYNQVLGTGVSCGKDTKSCGATTGQPDCPLGSHIYVDECVLNQEDLQEFIRAGNTAQIVGVKCLDMNLELDSQGMCVPKTAPNTKNGMRPTSQAPVKVSIDTSSVDTSGSGSGSSKSHKKLWIGLGAGLGAFLLILIALYFIYHNKKAMAKFFMSSRKRSHKRM